MLRQYNTVVVLTLIKITILGFTLEDIQILTGFLMMISGITGKAMVMKIAAGTQVSGEWR